MYESVFGLSASPFSLSPDPDFYFESRGHQQALSYLKFGVFQGEGFIVVTGDIGTGKTTLTRALLAGLDSEKVVAAQVVSTQLEAGDLLHAVAGAFGVPSKGLNKAALISAIEAYLTLLATQGRRALLIVDEAQNLGNNAVEELRMLSNFQLGSHALLQSFLVGQPELRKVLATKSMEQFRQRVIASCHLGPMNEEETKRYVLHRLRHVGWSGRPSFDDAALSAVHAFSGGIPRRINLVCNRIMLAAYLSAVQSVDGALVEKVASEMRAEAGEGALTMASVPAAQPAEPPVSETASAQPAKQGVVRRSAAQAAVPLVLLIADSPGDEMRAVAMVQTLAAGDAPYHGVVLRAEMGTAAPQLPASFQRAGLLPNSIPLDCSGAGRAGRFVRTLEMLLPIVQRERPSAIVVFGSSDAALAASLLASRSNTVLAHVARAPTTVAATDCNALVIPTQARLLFAEGADSAPPMASGPRCIGSLLREALDPITPHRVPASEVLHGLGLDSDAWTGPRGFGVVEANHLDGADPQAVNAFVQVLRAASEELPLVWTVSAALHQALQRQGVTKALETSWIAVVRSLEPLEMLGLLCEARVVLADDADGIELAQALGVRCVSLCDGTPTTSAVPLGRLMNAKDKTLNVQAWQALLHQPAPQPPLQDTEAGEAPSAIVVAGIRSLVDSRPSGSRTAGRTA